MVAKLKLFGLMLLMTSYLFSELTYQQFTQSLSTAKSMIADGRFGKLSSSLPEIENGNLLLYTTEPNSGINHGYYYYYYKSISLNYQNKYLEALSAGNNAASFLEISKYPSQTNSQQRSFQEITNQFLELKEQLKCLALIQIGKSAAAIHKNIFAENHFLYVVNNTNIQNQEILCDAVSELAELYIKQGRFNLAYQLINEKTLPKIKFLPKNLLLQRANISFYLNKNREAFNDLLAIMYDEPLNKEEPWSDPVLTLFIKRITRAEDTEIIALYDALESQINMLPIEDSYVDNIAFFILERMHLKKVCKFLDNIDDIENIRLRYQKIKN